MAVNGYGDVPSGIDLHDFGIRKDINFCNFRNWYRIGYAFSENWYKFGYIYWNNWYKEQVCF